MKKASENAVSYRPRDGYQYWSYRNARAPEGSTALKKEEEIPFGDITLGGRQCLYTRRQLFIEEVGVRCL